MALTRSEDPLVWIDCEMTGLSPSKGDTILSLSCYITSATLTPLDPDGYHVVISHPQSALSAMNDWCTSHHGASGLTAACLASTTTAAAAAEGLLGYIKRHIPEKGVGVLAGNSIHVDRVFLLREPWAAVLEYLHYRILDVSSIKEAVRRWCADESGVLQGCPRKEGRHEAKEDVLESLAEARYYMGLFRGMRIENGKEKGEGD